MFGFLCTLHAGEAENVSGHLNIFFGHVLPGGYWVGKKFG